MGAHTQGNVLTQLAEVIELLKAQNITREANALADVLVISRQPTELGGLGLSETDSLTSEQEAEITFLVVAWLESLNSTDRARAPPVPLAVRPPGRRGMTLSEKIFALHDIDRRGSVAPGELIRVDVDWVIASEASWAVRIFSPRVMNLPVDGNIGYGTHV